MAIKDLVVDFYELVLPHGIQPFENMVATFMQTNSFQQRTKAISGQFIRIAETHVNENVVEGDFTKIRMDNLPDKGSASQPDQPLNLGSDEGLSAGRAFYYYIPLKVLALHRNKNGASLTEMVGYFQQSFNIGGIVELKPVLKKDAYIRLQKMQEIKRFDLKFAGLKNAELLRGQGHDMEKLLDFLEFFQAPQAKINVSTGREKKTFLSKALKGFAEKLGALAQDYPSQIKQVELDGLDDNGKRQFVDMLLDPMVEKIKVNTVGRRLPYSERRNAVARAFSNMKPDLTKILRPSE